MFTDDRPVFQQLAALIEDDVVAGTYPEGSAVPSATDLATFYGMNPATASKGVNLLVDQGVLVKRRGVGMFVVEGARELLRARRRDAFAHQYVRPLLAEARVLGITTDMLRRMIEEEGQQP